MLFVLLLLVYLANGALDADAAAAMLRLCADIPKCASDSKYVYYFYTECHLEMLNRELIAFGDSALKPEPMSQCQEHCELIACPTDYMPVCGVGMHNCEPINFQNNCELGRKICTTQQNWRIIAETACPPKYGSQICAIRGTEVRTHTNLLEFINELKDQSTTGWAVSHTGPCRANEHNQSYMWPSSAAPVSKPRAWYMFKIARIANVTLVTTAEQDKAMSSVSQQLTVAAYDSTTPPINADTFATAVEAAAHNDTDIEKRKLFEYDVHDEQDDDDLVDSTTQQADILTTIMLATNDGNTYDTTTTPIEEDLVHPASTTTEAYMADLRFASASQSALSAAKNDSVPQAKTTEQATSLCSSSIDAQKNGSDWENVPQVATAVVPDALSHYTKRANENENFLQLAMTLIFKNSSTSTRIEYAASSNYTAH